MSSMVALTIIGLFGFFQIRQCEKLIRDLKQENEKLRAKLVEGSK